MENGDTSESQVAGGQVGVNMPQVEKVMPVIFYVATAIWIVSVAITIWTSWMNPELVNARSGTFSLRLQFVVSAVGSTWGYLLVAVVALSVTAFLRNRH